MLKKYLFGVCGNYGENGNDADGQVVRTINVTNELERAIGKDNMKNLNTFNFYKNPITFFIKLLFLGVESKNILLFCASNAVLFLVPFMTILKKILRIKVYYVVIGGWLAETIKEHKWLLYYIKKLDMLFVQTNTFKNSLQELGTNKVTVFPNFKRMEPLKKEMLIDYEQEPLKICFFSRIIKEKGIEELIEKIKKVNHEKIIYHLDIYGCVDENYIERFDELQKSFPEYIKYLGVVESDKTVDAIKEYFLQVFPTKYKTEGFPGSILDSYCAGVPVLVSKWNSWSDIIEEGVTGFAFEFDDFDDMEKKLIEISRHPSLINSMKLNCLEKAEQLRPEKVIKILLDVIEV